MSSGPALATSHVRRLERRRRSWRPGRRPVGPGRPGTPKREEGGDEVAGVGGRGPQVGARARVVVDADRRRPTPARRPGSARRAAASTAGRDRHDAGRRRIAATTPTAGRSWRLGDRWRRGRGFGRRLGGAAGGGGGCGGGQLDAPVPTAAPAARQRPTLGGPSTVVQRVEAVRRRCRRTGSDASAQARTDPATTARRRAATVASHCRDASTPGRADPASMRS